MMEIVIYYWHLQKIGSSKLNHQEIFIFDDPKKFRRKLSSIVLHLHDCGLNSMIHKQSDERTIVYINKGRFAQS